MSRIKAYLAYSWAALAVPLVLATFMGMQPLAGKLVAVTGLHVHPIYTGGEVAQTIDHGSYQTLIHRPVFDGLIGRRNTGFIQVKWQSKDAHLPAMIEESIDFDADGSTDFRIQFNTVTQEARIEPSDSRVLSLDEAILVSDGQVIRVSLRRSAP